MSKAQKQINRYSDYYFLNKQSLFSSPKIEIELGKVKICLRL
jgi:hypothetical protein